ncbi:hypothetical protein ANN_09995 [Periplaneta americana]|uniref:Uncharacterized protein n=1 Tax=Periplaneta americana TaxID=6978 RepID=A0ABQ8TMY4_PERAM|nr:hypothetical protein ANN_09995 [Periplaneta americana]
MFHFANLRMYFVVHCNAGNETEEDGTLHVQVGSTLMQQLVTTLTRRIMYGILRIMNGRRYQLLEYLS